MKLTKTLMVTLATVVAIGGLVAIANHAPSLFATNAEAAIKPVPEEVDVAEVQSSDIVDYQNYSGRIEAIDRVAIRPLVSGTIVDVSFKDGALVKRGQLLFTIDPRPFIAQRDRAKAQLAAALSRKQYADTDSKRADRLVADNAMARRDFDLAKNAEREAQANVQAAAAALESADVDLGYTRIVSPITGRVSRAELTVGNVVSNGANAPVLTSVVSVSPIYASFDMDERSFLRYVDQPDPGQVSVALGLANEPGYSRKGRLDSVDNEMDRGSGTIRIRARFDNADGRLVPGLYAKVKVSAGAPHPALLVSDEAIGTDQDKKFVMVVDNAGLVKYRGVDVGNEINGFTVISKGLQPGERVVVNGLQRIRPNDIVSAKMVKMSAHSIE